MNVEIKRSINRNTCQLKIINSNTIRLNCPLFMTKSKINQILKDKSSWIDKKIKQINNNQLIYGDIDYIKNVIICGKKYKIDVNIGTERAVLLDNKVEICLKSKNHNKNKIINIIFNEYYKKLLNDLNKMSEKIGIKYKSIKFYNYKSRWGSCSIKGDISLNKKMFILNQEQINYIIIHELCHIKEFNHSNKFWNLVKQHCPEYKKINKEIKNMSILLK